MGDNIVYDWIDENGNSISSEISPTVSTPGIYNLVVTNNENDCSATENIEITQDILIPDADAGQALTITCDVTDVTLDGSLSSIGLSLIHI